jgi:hypothetical protein
MPSPAQWATPTCAMTSSSAPTTGSLWSSPTLGVLTHLAPAVGLFLHPKKVALSLCAAFHNSSDTLVSRELITSHAVRVPITAVEVKLNGQWLPLERTVNNQWPYYNTNGPWQSSFPMPIRVTSVTGETIEDAIPSQTGGNGSKQFTSVSGSVRALPCDLPSWITQGPACLLARRMGIIEVCRSSCNE